MSDLSAVEADNQERVERLLRLGVPDIILALTALGVRVNGVVHVLQSAGLDMERLAAEYESDLAVELDEMIAELSKPRLFSPDERG